VRGHFCVHDAVIPTGAGAGGAGRAYPDNDHRGRGGVKCARRGLGGSHITNIINETSPYGALQPAVFRLSIDGAVEGLNALKTLSGN